MNVNGVEEIMGSSHDLHGMKASRQVGKQEWFKLVSMLLKEK